MRTLIAGFGNVLLQDDGFGVEVIRRLASTTPREGIDLVDVGIGGMHLVNRLQDGYDRLIIIDAISGDGTPGQLHVLECRVDLDQPISEAIGPHFTDPSRALLLAAKLRVLPPLVTLVGCVPASCGLEVGLTPAVRSTADDAAALIVRMIAVA